MSVKGPIKMGHVLGTLSKYPTLLGAGGRMMSSVFEYFHTGSVTLHSVSDHTCNKNSGFSRVTLRNRVNADTMFSMLERYMLECSKTPVAGTRSYTSAARQCTSTRHQQHARSTKCSSTSPSQPQWQPPPHLWPTGRPLDQTKRAETWQLQDPNWLREN